MIQIPVMTIGQKIAAVAGVAVLSAIFGAWGGGKLVNNHWQAKEAKRLQAEQKEYARLSGIAQDLGVALAAEARKRQEDARAWRRKFDSWRQDASVQVDCPAQGLKLVVPGAVRFGDGAVALWNDGLCAGLPKTSGACRPDAAPVGANPVTTESVWDNAADNAAACNADRARLRAAQKYLKEIGAAGK